jgi:transposase
MLTDRTGKSRSFITDPERTLLSRWARARTSPQRLVLRSQIVLLANNGNSTSTIAKALHTTPPTVRLWCARFKLKGANVLAVDQPGRGRPAGISFDVVRSVLLAQQSHSPVGVRWTARALASRAATSASTVWRIWKRYALSADSSAGDIDHALAKLISETRNSDAAS